MRCFACNRDTSDGDYVLVRFIYVTVRVCSDCWSRDDGVETRLDLTVDVV